MRRKNNRLVTEEDWCHLWKARKSSYFFTRNWEKSNKVFSERRMGRWGQIMDIKAHSYIGIHPIFCLSAYFGLIFLTVLPLVDFYLVCWNLTNDGMRQRSYHLLGDVLFQSAAPSELILSISGNLLEGLIRFRPRIKTNDTHVERIFRKKNSGGKIKRKLITNGPFSPLGRLCEWMRKQYWTLPAITTRFLLQNGFSPTQTFMRQQTV